MHPQAVAKHALGTLLSDFTFERFVTRQGLRAPSLGVRTKLAKGVLSQMELKSSLVINGKSSTVTFSRPSLVVTS